MAAVSLAVSLGGCGPAGSATPTPAVPPHPAPPDSASPDTAPNHTDPTVSATGALAGVTGGGPGSVAVAPFAESDAAPLRAGGPARVAVEALDGLELPATVVAVAPTAVQISGVTNYYVTVALTEGDSRLRVGQTVLVTIPVPPR